PSFRWESSLRTWLAGILVNCCREASRAGTRDRDMSRSAPFGVTAQPARLEESLDLRSALATLPDGFREIRILHDAEGFTHEEIATMLRIDSGTSKSQLSRARQALRARLAENAGVARRGERSS